MRWRIACPAKSILIVTDSWFGNNGLFAPMRKQIRKQTDILSRLRANASLYDLPAARTKH